MQQIIKYDLIQAYANGVRQHPQLDVEALGMKVVSFAGEQLGDYVIMGVENVPDKLPGHITISRNQNIFMLGNRKKYSPQETSEYIEMRKAFLDTFEQRTNMNGSWEIDRTVTHDTSLSIPEKKDMEHSLFSKSEPYFLDAAQFNLTCNTCEHRQRHQCNSKVFQYCGVRKSNRTDNGLLKIKCKTAACPLYKH